MAKNHLHRLLFIFLLNADWFWLCCVVG